MIFINIIYDVIAMIHLLELHLLDIGGLLLSVFFKARLQSHLRMHKNWLICLLPGPTDQNNDILFPVFQSQPTINIYCDNLQDER